MVFSIKSSWNQFLGYYFRGVRNWIGKKPSNWCYSFHQLQEQVAIKQFHCRLLLFFSLKFSSFHQRSGQRKSLSYEFSKICQEVLINGFSLLFGGFHFRWLKVSLVLGGICQKFQFRWLKISLVLSGTYQWFQFRWLKVIDIL